MEVLYDKSKICIVGKSNCPFCKKALKLIKEKYGFQPVYIELNGMKNSRTYHDELIAMTDQTTVPYIFIYGDFLGGYSELSEVHNYGVLKDVIDKKCVLICSCGELFCSRCASN